MTGGVRIDLERWWRRGDAAIDGWMQNAMGRATFAVTPGAGADGRWRIRITVKVRARGPFFPFAAPALFVNRLRIRRSIVTTLDTFAKRWNREVPVLVAAQPDELRELIMTELRKG